ncbi:hypothetical protein ZHAS_00020572 [Anopheles sinensis]|uniref:Uncharacterized protein n=1 Tax=Anopheles sinensis TaxID=74873 RepID=A0A084WQ62_ANOSI|nr:hypothetical protein ZHAS_00020572 [Anopheles sinensis]
MHPILNFRHHVGLVMLLPRGGDYRSKEPPSSPPPAQKTDITGSSLIANTVVSKPDSYARPRRRQLDSGTNLCMLPMTALRFVALSEWTPEPPPFSPGKLPARLR